MVTSNAMLYIAGADGLLRNRRVRSTSVTGSVLELCFSVAFRGWTGMSRINIRAHNLLSRPL